MHLTHPTCFSEDIDIPITGKLTNAVNLNLSFPNGQIASFTDLTRVGGHPSWLGGYYNVTAGGCISASQGGASADRVAVGGEWSGPLTASSSAITNITITFQQTGPDSNGFFSATGTATLSGDTCFTADTVDSANTRILGRGSTATLVSASPIGGTIVLTGDFSGGGALFPDFNGTYTLNLGSCSQTRTVSMGT